jgi:sec-independent protein translocase protein TatC
MASQLPPERTQAEIEHDEGGRMSFFDHLNELRKRIIYAMGAVLVGAIAGLYLSQRVIGWITQPIMDALRALHMEERLYYNSPTGAINIIIKVGLYIGLVIASPVVLYQVWLFIAPGLYKHEKKAAAVFLVSSVSLFLGGIAFCYFVLLPYTLRFLIGFNLPYFTPLISINEYWDLVLILMLGMGLIFQTPILVFFLALFGIVTPGFMIRNFRYAILIIALVAAIVTPTPDALTMLIFMAPMIGLYALSIAVAAVVVRRKKRADAMAREGAA